MKKNLFIFWNIFFLFLHSISLSAQLRDLPRYHVDNIPDSLRGKGVEAVMREYHTVLEVKNISETKYMVRYAVTVFSEHALAWTMLHINYDSKFHKVSDIEGKLYDASGAEIKRLKSSNIRDFSDFDGINISDNRQKIAKFDAVLYPATFVFSYELTSSNTMFYPHWNPHFHGGIPVENASMEVKTVSNNDFRFKSFHLPEPKKSTEDGQKIWKWEVKNLKKHNNEPFSPNDSIAFPLLLLAPTAFQVENYKGNMTTWEDFGKFIYKLYDKRDEIPETLKKELNDLVADCPDNRCKVARIYEYLQKNNRYVSIQLGIGGWQPMLATEVASKKYGDCKALSNYTKALLKAVGVASSIVIISGGKNYIPLQRDFPVSTFNHAILAVPMEKDTLWLECTSEDGAEGFCGNFTGNRDALVIDDNGGTIGHTKNYSEKENQCIRRAFFQLNTEGVATAHISTQLSGVLIDPYKIHVTQGDKDRRDAYFENAPFSNFDIKKIDYKYERALIPKVNEEVDLQINTYAKKSGKRLFVPINLFKSFEMDIANLESLKDKRTMPIEITRFPFERFDTITIAIPSGFQIENRPQGVTLDNCFGTYKADIIVEKNTIQYIRYFKANNTIFPKEKYNELLDFFDKMQKADRLKLVLVAQ